MYKIKNASKKDQTKLVFIFLGVFRKSNRHANVNLKNQIYDKSIDLMENILSKTFQN